VNETIRFYDIIYYILILYSAAVAYSVPRTGLMVIKDRDGVGAVSYPRTEERKKERLISLRKTSAVCSRFLLFFS